MRLTNTRWRACDPQIARMNTLGEAHNSFAASLSVVGRVGKAQPALVFFRQDRVLHGPGNGELRIVPDNRPLAGRMIEIGALVDDFRLVRKRAKAVGKARRYV